MKEVDNGVPLRFEKRLRTSLSEDLRVEMLRLLDERPLTIREMAKAFGEPVSGIAPHVFELWKEGSIDLAESDSGVPLADRPFHATRLLFDTAEWEALSADERYEATVRILEGMFGEAMASLRSGHMTARSDAHLTWFPMTVDEEGWSETTAVLERAFGELEAIGERSAERLGRAERPGTPVVVSLLGFERSH